MKTTLEIVSILKCQIFFSNFLTEAPGQYTGPGMGGLVTRGGGPAGVMMPGQNMQPGQPGPRASEYTSSFQLSSVVLTITHVS